MKSPSLLALAAVIALTLTGCGKESVAASSIAPIDSAFTRLAADDARSEVGQAQQQRKDAEAKQNETSRPSSKTSDAKGFRPHLD